MSSQLHFINIKAEVTLSFADKIGWTMFLKGRRNLSPIPEVSCCPYTQQNRECLCKIKWSQEVDRCFSTNEYTSQGTFLQIRCLCVECNQDKGDIFTADILHENYSMSMKFQSLRRIPRQ